MRIVHRCRYGNDNEVRLAQDKRFRVITQQARCPQILTGHLTGGIDSVAISRDFLHRKVKTECPELLAELNCQGKAYVPKANYCHCRHCLIPSKFLDCECNRSEEHTSELQSPLNLV